MLSGGMVFCTTGGPMFSGGVIFLYNRAADVIGRNAIFSEDGVIVFG